MSKQQISDSQQHLSDLLDDNASSEAIDDVLASDQQRASWYRYNLVSSVLKEENSAFSTFEFSQSIAAKIALEPAMISRQAAAQSPELKTSSNIIPLFKRATGGLAIAASVAFAMVFSVEMMNQQPDASLSTDIADNQTTSSVLNTASLEMPSTLLTAAELDEQERLDELQQILNTMSKNSLNVYEQQVGGEWVFSKVVKPAKNELEAFEAQVNNMKKPSEVASDKE